MAFVGFAGNVAEPHPPPKQAALFGGDRLRRELEAERLGDTDAVCRVGPRAVLDMPLLDVCPCITHRAGGVLKQRLLLRGGHLTEQIAGLFPVVLTYPMVIVRTVPVDRRRRLGVIGLIVPQARAVRIECECSAEIAVGPHLAVAMVAL